jgi:probable phosphoglycerate mutase
VGRELGLPVAHVDPAFRERAYGLFEGLTRGECEERHPEAWARFADPLSTPTEGEPVDAVRGRMLQGAQRAAALLATPLLIVSHGRAIRELTQAISGTPLYPIPNVGLVRLILHEDRWLEARLVPL